MYLELFMLVAMVVAVVRIASTDDQSPVLWGVVAVALGLASVFFLPLPFGRVLLAGVLTFVAMTVYKVIANK